MEKTHGKRGEVVTVPVHGLPPMLREGLEVFVVPPALKGPRSLMVREADLGRSGQLVALEGVSGIGEAIRPIASAPQIPLVLVTPGGGLSTAEVFRLWDEGSFPPVSLDVRALAGAVTRNDLAAVDRLCANALTAPAIQLMPEIDSLIRRMRELGAGAAFMTGSGSTVVGAFADDAAARSAAASISGAVLTHTGER